MERPTDGPWQLRERMRGDDPYEIIGGIDGDADDDGRLRMTCTEVCEVADNDDAEANARLIVAAPTLLAAAIQALARWPISLRGSPLEKAVYEAQGLPPPPPEERRQVDLAGMARATFAVPTPER